MVVCYCNNLSKRLKEQILCKILESIYLFLFLSYMDWHILLFLSHKYHYAPLEIIRVFVPSVNKWKSYMYRELSFKNCSLCLIGFSVTKWHVRCTQPCFITVYNCCSFQCSSWPLSSRGISMSLVFGLDVSQWTWFSLFHFKSRLNFFLKVGFITP